MLIGPFNSPKLPMKPPGRQTSLCSQIDQRLWVGATSFKKKTIRSFSIELDWWLCHYCWPWFWLYQMWFQRGCVKRQQSIFKKNLNPESSWWAHVIHPLRFHKKVSFFYFIILQHIRQSFNEIPTPFVPVCWFFHWVSLLFIHNPHT